jgi:hypothetical protein
MSLIQTVDPEWADPLECGSEDLGFLLGPYDLDGIANFPGHPKDHGHHVTMIMKEGGDSRILSQLLVSNPDDTPSLGWQGEPDQLLIPQETGASVASPDLSRFSQAWQNGDQEATQENLNEAVVFRQDWNKGRILALVFAPPWA